MRAIALDVHRDFCEVAIVALLEGHAVQVVEGVASPDPLAHAMLETREAAALLAVPVLANGRTVGALEIYADEARPWSRYDVHRTRIIAHQLRETITRLRDHGDVVSGASVA